MSVQPHVGTLGEKPLHASMKRWYWEPGDRVEVPIDGFVIDLVRGDELIEIQTRGFTSMKRKFGALLDDHPFRLVHPIPVEKTIVKVDDDGVEISRRRSPKHGLAVDVFAELVSFPHLVEHPNLTLDVVLVREEEVRHFVEGKAWRRKGWVIDERRLVDVVDVIVIDHVDDLACLLPTDLPDPFTTAELARAVGRPRRLAQQMAYCLRHVGVIEGVAKRGNAVLYALA